MMDNMGKIPVYVIGVVLRNSLINLSTRRFAYLTDMICKTAK